LDHFTPPFMLFRRAYCCLQTVSLDFLQKAPYPFSSTGCAVGRLNVCVLRIHDIMSLSHCLEKAPLGIADGHASKKEKNSKRDFYQYEHGIIAWLTQDCEIVKVGLLVCIIGGKGKGQRSRASAVQPWDWSWRWFQPPHSHKEEGSGQGLQRISRQQIHSWSQIILIAETFSTTSTHVPPSCFIILQTSFSVQ
jgi:hypothetical protein